MAGLTAELGDEDLVRELVKEDRSLIRFYIPDEHTWDKVRENPAALGERLTDAMRAISRETPTQEIL